MNLDPQKPVLNREEVAQLLEISTRTLDKLTHSGEIPSFKVGRQVRYSVHSLKEWIQAEIGKIRGDS